MTNTITKEQFDFAWKTFAKVLTQVDMDTFEDMLKVQDIFHNATFQPEFATVENGLGE